jgi:hypothetical protein
MAHKFIMLSHPPCAVVPSVIFFREIPAYTVIVIFISQDVLSPKSMNSPFCPFTVFKTFFLQLADDNVSYKVIIRTDGYV